MANFEAMKEEAIRRMKKLELHPDCIKAFEKDNQVWESELLGALAKNVYAIVKGAESSE